MEGAVLVGREREIRALEDALSVAAAGKPRVVLLEGRAGFGKSSLLQALRSTHRDLMTLAWVGDENETPLSFAMVDQLLEVVRKWGDPFAAGAALLSRLGERAAEGPLVLALDDVHLADRPSLVALNFALRRLRHDPVLALLSVRAGHLRALPPSMVGIAHDQGTHRVLEGLTVASVQELAVVLGTGRLSRRAAERLCAVTRGSPLHLRALLTEVPATEIEELDRPLPAPESFAQLILAELAGASTAARLAAEAAAVLGERCELSDLLEVTELDRAAGLLALDELARLHLVRVRPGSSTVVFEHPLVRAAVYGDLGPGTRAHLHRAAANLSDGWLSLRHRISANHGTDGALGDDLEAWSNRERQSENLSAAAEAMVAAHRVTPAGPDADRRLLAAVGLFAMAGDAKSAQSYAARIAALPLSQRRLAVQALTAWLTGDLDDAVTLGRRAWDGGELDWPERDLLASMLAQIEIFRDHSHDAVTWATRALARGHLDPLLASNTRMQLVLGLATSGRHREAWDALADLPEDPTEVEIGRHPELVMRGFLTSWEGPRAAAERDLTVGADLTQGDMQPFRLEAAANLALSMFQDGRWDDSQATLLQTLALAEDMEQTWSLGFLNALCAAVPSARGEWTTAQEYVTAAVAYGEKSTNLATAAYADDAAILLATARGEPEAVVRAAERVRRAPEISPRRDLGIFCWPAHLVAALVELGRLEEAEAELAVLVRRARQGGRRTEAPRQRVAGQLAAARHENAMARDCFRQGLCVADEYVDAFERALGHEAYGRFLRRRGERRSAVDQLRRARGRYQALGAVPFADRCDVELAACGIHDSEAIPAHDPLTPQERAVAALVMAGKTNRQAAQELVVSVKTVNYHLANVYTKLDVHSRAQLVAAMQNQDH